jgi:hypothetical protein
MRLIARRRRPRPRCSKRWRNVRSLLPGKRTRYPSSFWCWRPRILSSKRYLPIAGGADGPFSPARFRELSERAGKSMRSFRITRGSVRRLSGFFGTFFWMFAGGLWAQDTAKVRTELEVNGDVWLGQGMTLVVELLSPGFFAGSPTFYLPRVPGVIIFQPNERPVLSSKTIDGASAAEIAKDSERCKERSRGPDKPRTRQAKNPRSRDLRAILSPAPPCAA